MSNPPPTLHISKGIEEKIFQKHGVTANRAREIFEANFRDAYEHPVDPKKPPPEDADPLFVIEKWDLSEASFWFLVFALYSAHEAELVTCFRRARKKRWLPKLWSTK